MWPPSAEFIQKAALRTWERTRDEAVVLVYASDPTMLIMEPKYFAPTRYVTRKVTIKNCDIIVYIGKED